MGEVSQQLERCTVIDISLLHHKSLQDDDSLT